VIQCLVHLYGTPLFSECHKRIIIVILVANIAYHYKNSVNHYIYLGETIQVVS
jgi:hypothetical protein